MVIVANPIFYFYFIRQETNRKLDWYGYDEYELLRVVNYHANQLNCE